jgi:adenylate cyclase, class 2
VGGVSAGPVMRDRETEVKIRVPQVRVLRARLKQLGFVPVHPKAFEDNVLFDTPDRKLRAVRSVLRLRRYRREWSVTYKGTPEADPHYKSRVELESHLDNPHSVRAIFAVLGLIPAFRYQKYRTKYALARRGRRADAVEVALDETPIGDFIELEGTRRGIDRVARQLGYSKDDYSTASYGALYLEDCARRNIAPTDMVFSSPAGKRRSRQTPQLKAGARRRAGS